MALLAKEIKFTSNSGTPPFDQSVPVGLGAAGKAVLVFYTDQTAEGTAANARLGVGIATGASNRACIASSNDDNLATTDTGRRFDNTRFIGLISGAGTLLAAGQFKSFDGADGDFTITWQTVDPGAGRIFYAVVIGGSDITAQTVTTLTLNASTGNQSYAHGLGATPNFAFYITCNGTTAATVTNGTFSMGWAVSDSKRGSVSINADDGVNMTASMDWNSIYANDRCLICLSNTASTVDIEFDHVSFDATNVTFNQINAPTVNTLLAGLFLAGGQYDAGSFNKCTTANCTDSPATVLQPKAIFMASVQEAGSANNRQVLGSCVLSLGAATAADGTQEGSVAVAGVDAVLNTQCDQQSTSAKTNSHIDGGNPGAMVYESDTTALGATSFSEQWTTNNAVAATQLWFAIGEAGVAPVFPPLLERHLNPVRPHEPHNLVRM